MNTPSIRKQVGQLTASDFDQYPRWIYASGEESDDDQDECTVRPLGPNESVANDEPVHVQAVFFFPNGRVRFGAVTLQAGDTLAGHQPRLWSDGGSVGFFNGALKPSRAEAARFHQALKAIAPEPFPLRYVSALSEPDGRPLAYGELNGLHWLSDWRTGEMKIV